MGQPTRPDMTGLSKNSTETAIALPMRAMLATVATAALGLAGIVLILSVVGAIQNANVISGLNGIAAVAAVMIVGVFLMTPWRSRPIADWMTLWLAATVFRLLVTPVVVYLLYSLSAGGDASPALAAGPLVISVAIAYFVTLLSEAAVVASHVKRFCRATKSTA
jgi:hypothetical protein